VGLLLKVPSALLCRNGAVVELPRESDRGFGAPLRLEPHLAERVAQQVDEARRLKQALLPRHAAAGHGGGDGALRGQPRGGARVVLRERVQQVAVVPARDAPDAPQLRRRFVG
jgi:hypothetical protein